ncbi:MAG: type II toxin-antitoxin system prevent-host-death family antitoxin [Chthoniobacterales bacterium]|nr:type II toxin-antitoxin system prevent-host-death family antitoxin [Chthoniobacterales bacterium]
MTTLSYTKARESLAGIWDETISTREPIKLSRRGKEPVALLPWEELRGLEETAYLLRSPANAQRLVGALDRINRGEYETFTMEELRAKLNLN